MSFLKTKLIDIAIEARHFSHSPYSTKKIGSAIQLDNGKIYSGCNIENASYGGTVCAERVAIWKAFSENTKPIKIKTVVVSSDESSPWPPCGMCRQVIAEFGSTDTEIILVNLNKKEITMTFTELFPFAFEPKHLG
jgi:cytidine deaminase